MNENENTEKPIPRNEAKGIRIKLEKLETAFMVVFWNAILERLNKVCSDSELICRCIKVSDIYGSLVEFTIAERENFD